MYPFTFVQPFDDADETEDLAHIFELVIPPARGQDIILAPGEEPCRVQRVEQTARVAAGPHGWEPGFRAVALVCVILEPMPRAERPRLLAAGWAPA